MENGFSEVSIGPVPSWFNNALSSTLCSPFPEVGGPTSSSLDTAPISSALVASAIYSNALHSLYVATFLFISAAAVFLIAHRALENMRKLREEHEEKSKKACKEAEQLRLENQLREIQAAYAKQCSLLTQTMQNSPSYAIIQSKIHPLATGSGASLALALT